jgi:hypothetical protein
VSFQYKRQTSWRGRRKNVNQKEKFSIDDEMEKVWVVISELSTKQEEE